MLPDTLLFCSLCVLVLVAAFVESRRFLTWACIGTVLAYLWGVSYQGGHQDALKLMANAHLQSLFAFDASAQGMKGFAGLVTLAVLFFLDAVTFKQPSEHGKEGSLIVLFGLLGASLMVGASHFLMSYLGLELLSLSLVVLIAWGLETPQLEAGVKYFILSSLASGILLFGVSLIYGATGHLNFVSSAMVRYPFHDMYVVGQIFLVAGVAFKLGWVPFHFWISDVYASARWYTIVALGSLSKIGVVGFMLRLFDAGVFASNGPAWAVQLMIVLSVLSILIGNILAIQQKSLRRLLAYSSVANMGFLGLALVCKSGAPFYLAVYVLNTLPIAAVLFTEFGQYLEASLDDLKGFGLRHPYQGIVLTFAMLSLAGIPMTPGFWAKWHVFKEFFSRYSPLFGVFIVLGTLIGTFYYLRVVKFLYAGSDEQSPATDGISFTQRHEAEAGASGAFSYALLLLGISALLLWCAASPDRWLNWSGRITGEPRVVSLDDSRKTPVSPVTTLNKGNPVPIIIPPSGFYKDGRRSVVRILPPQRREDMHAR